MLDLSTLPFDRRQQIASRLLWGETVSAAALATEFLVSEDAIRRDLRALAAEGICKRVYGGALPLSPTSSSINARSGEDIGCKRALARAATELVCAEQTLFLDTGSTNRQLAEELPENAGLTVVTNSVPVAAMLMGRPGIALVVIGGRADTTIGGCVGARSIAELQRFRIDLCFLGVSAISIEHGIAGFDMADVDFKRGLMEVSAETAVMLTTVKLETVAPHRIGRVTDVNHLIVEHDAPSSIVATLRETGTAVRIADAPFGWSLGADFWDRHDPFGKRRPNAPDDLRCRLFNPTGLSYAGMKSGSRPQIAIACRPPDPKRRLAELPSDVQILRLRRKRELDPSAA